MDRLPLLDDALSDLEIQLESKYDVDLSLWERNGIITLSKIYVTNKGEGVGHKVMQELIEYADKNKLTIALTPSIDFGATSISRLKKFYKEFGFVENKGKNIDFTISETMYRLPQ